MFAQALTIRPHRPADHESLVALWNTVFPDDPPWNEPGKLIQTKLTVQPELLFVACQDTKIVGAIMAGFDGVRGWVHHLAVDPASRRQGIATTLMRAAESGRSMLRATNTGMTAIIGTHGEMLSVLPSFTRAALRGEVVHGDARGREIGFPTANLGGEVEGLRRDGSSFPLDLSVNRADISGEVIFVPLASSTHD